MGKPLQEMMEVQDHNAGEGVSFRSIGLILLTVYLMAGPLANRLQIIRLNQYEATLTNVPYVFDIFAALKSQLVSAFGLAFLAVLILVTVRKEHGGYAKGPAAAVAGFIGFLTVSTLLSPYPVIVMRGVFDRFEGYPVWLAYALSFLIAMLCVRGAGGRRYVKAMLLYSVTLQVLLGISQFLGHNLLNYPPLSTIVAGDVMRSLYDLGQLRSGGTAFGSINNPNFYSQLMALLMAMLFPTLQEKGWYPKLAFFAAGLCLSFAGSSGGLIGLGATVLVLGLWAGTGKRGAAVSLALLMGPAFGAGLMEVSGMPLSLTDAFLCIGIPIAYLGGLWLRHPLKRFGIRRLSIGLLALLGCSLIAFIGWASVPRPENQVVNRIEILRDHLVIHYPEGQLSFKAYDGSRVDVIDGGAVLIEGITEGAIDIVDLKEHVDIIAEAGYSLLKFERLGAGFVVDGDRFFYQEARPVATDTEMSSPYWGFVGKERFGSGRGYIWSRTLPLLTHVLLFGKGPDVFPFVFPQYDYVGTINMGAANIMIDKPHNWYLQMMISFGMGGLLSLILLGRTLCSASLSLITRSTLPSEEGTVAISLLGLVFCYGFTGMFYDSVISVSMLVWPLAGAYAGLLNGYEGRSDVTEAGRSYGEARTGGNE